MDGQTEVILLRMTPTLRSMVEAKAKELGLRRTEFIRMALVAASEPIGEKNRKRFSEVRDELVKS